MRERGRANLLGRSCADASQLPMAAICLRWVASKTSLVTALLPFPLQHLLNPAAIGARGIRRRPN